MLAITPHPSYNTDSEDFRTASERYIGQSEWQRGTLGDEAAQILAASPRCRNLLDLNLYHNRIGDVGAAALASSPHLAQLQRLELTRNDIGPKGREQLKTRFGDRVLFGTHSMPNR